jgi:hypothetical protein
MVKNEIDWLFFSGNTAIADKDDEFAGRSETTSDPDQFLSLLRNDFFIYRCP